MQHSKQVTVAACCALGLSFLYATFVATYRIDLPGLYYDEALFLPAAFQILGNCGDYAPVSLRGPGCMPLLLAPFYLGALKTYLYALLVAMFPVSAELIRLPPMILALLLAFLSFRFFDPRLGRPWAALIATFMLTSPVYLWHARIDWGPFIIGAIFRFLVFAHIIRWLETRQPRNLALAAIAFSLGLYDKLNFIWLLLPLTVAFVAVYPRDILAAIKAYPCDTAVIVLLSVTVGLFFFFFNIIPAWRLQLYPRNIEAIDNAWRVIYLMRNSFSGEAQIGWMLHLNAPLRSILGLIFFAQLLVGTLLASTGLIVRRHMAPEQQAAINIFLVLHTLILGCVLTLILSADATGSHHAVFLLPMITYQGVASLKVATLFCRSVSAKVYPIAMLVVILISGLIVTEQLRVGMFYLRALTRDAHAYKPNFTPEIYALAEHINTLDADAIISVDWGTHMQLVSMAIPGHHNRYRDYWPYFNSANPNDRAVNPILERVSPNKTAVFIFQQPPHVNMPNAVAHFKDALARLPACARSESLQTTAIPSAFVLIVIINNCR